MVQKLIDWLRYSRHWSQLVFIPLLIAVNYLYRMKGKKAHLNFLSMAFKLQWPGTYTFVVAQIKRHFLTSKKQLHSDIYKDFLSDDSHIERYKKFSEQPELMLDGMITVVSPHTTDSKGVIIIAYSYYFKLFLKYYDFEAIKEKYHLVLEPSWNGLCDESILLFSKFDVPVFIMAYEDRDYNFIQDLNTNLVPLRLSANWWVSPEQFSTVQPIENRDIDVIMVAAWAKFKRHSVFFKTIKHLKDQGIALNVVLVGYPNDLTGDDIRAQADSFSISEQITIYEFITPEEVSELLGRAKVNIVWSRFEGLNRAIIEGMFCNTPCILREGFNFGMHYPYINDQTGCFVKEKDLPEAITNMLNNFSSYSPRQYVLKHHNCYVASKKLADYIKQYDRSYDTDLMLPKTSGLNGMEYLNKSDSEKVEKDYAYLLSKLH